MGPGPRRSAHLLALSPNSGAGPFQSIPQKGAQPQKLPKPKQQGQAVHGYGSKLDHQGTGFSACFHLGFYLAYLFLTHTRIALPWYGLPWKVATWSKTCGPIPGGLILTHTHFKTNSFLGPFLTSDAPWLLGARSDLAPGLVFSKMKFPASFHLALSTTRSPREWTSISKKQNNKNGETPASSEANLLRARKNTWPHANGCGSKT